MTTVPAPPPGTVPPPPKSSCLKWTLIGCFTLLALCVVGFAAIVIIVFGAIKSTDAYKGARDQATNDPRVIEALGTPIKTGIWVIGNVNVDANGGNANFEFPISGPKGDARVHATATRDTAGWHYSSLFVTRSGAPPIDLLKP